jgi:hypothetical protein
MNKKFDEKFNEYFFKFLDVFCSPKVMTVILGFLFICLVFNMILFIINLFK